jgi:hypothetical protein
MDEVDFTILAATSVLGDLIEKCPPAEACRDAFNRMSKATVQMCMSTTGFSSSAQGLNSNTHRSESRTNDMSNQDYFGGTTTAQLAHSNARNHKASRNHRLSNEQSQLQQAASRPKPQFDMGLNDLFPIPQPQSDQGGLQTAFRSPGPSGNNGTRPTTIKKEYNASEAFGIPASQIHSPSDYAISPTHTRNSAPTPNLDNSAIDPTLLPNSNLQGVQQVMTPMANFGNGDANWSYADLDFPLQGMDFLQQGNGRDLNGVGGAPGQGNMGGENGGMGMDMGFGLGWEGMDHDWTEGNQVDLFDGFFFGGNGGG